MVSIEGADGKREMNDDAVRKPSDVTLEEDA